MSVVDDEDDGLLEDEEGGADDGDIFAPPGDDDYEGIDYYVGLGELPRGFADVPQAREFLQRPLSTFAARFSNGNSNGRGFDPILFSHLVARTARLHRWVSNSKFKNVEYPGVLATLPGSLIVHFTVSPGEAQQRRADEREYPSVYGARALARLLAATNRPEPLLRAVHPLGKRAVNTFMGTLHDSVDKDLTIEVLTHEGQHSKLTPARAERAIVTLDIVPEMLTRPPVTVVGLLDRPDHEKARVKLTPREGSPRLLDFSPHLEDRIRDAWGRYIVGTMVLEEPSNPSLPRAPARRRTLMSIEHVVEDVDTLPDDLLSLRIP